MSGTDLSVEVKKLRGQLDAANKRAQRNEDEVKKLTRDLAISQTNLGQAEADLMKVKEQLGKAKILDENEIVVFKPVLQDIFSYIWNNKPQRLTKRYAGMLLQNLLGEPTDVQGFIGQE